MRVVFDTNIVVSGWLWSGAPHKAIAVAKSGQITLVISEAMVDELKDVLNRPKFEHRLKIIAQTVDEVVSDYLQFTQVIEASPIIPTISADPDDDLVLACALSGIVDFVVTGDPHLLELRNFRGIPIITVNDFLEHMSNRVE